MRKTDATIGCPIDHCRHKRPALRNKGDVAGWGVAMRETRIETMSWHLQAYAVRPEYPQAVWFGRIKHCLLYTSDAADDDYTV